MTPLTFGNHLKFGPDSCHNTKGRPTFLHRERERERALEASREQNHIYIFREGPSNGAPQAQELSPWRVVERGLTTTVAVFPPRSNQGQASTAMLD